MLAIGTMATNEEKEAILTKPDDVEAGVLKWRGVQVENIGKRGCIQSVDWTGGLD